MALRSLDGEGVFGTMRVLVMVLLALAPVAALAATMSAKDGASPALPPRAERPIVAPPAEWVLPATIPAADPANMGVAVSVLLLDQQAHLTREADARYVETAIRIGTSQGLQAAPLALAWDPSLETLVIHRYRLLRDGKAIDLLGDGSKLTVVRRETNLELATLDGQLTATLQPEDVRVGDVIEIAYTQTRRDPALQGRSQFGFTVVPGLPVARMRVRALWPAEKPVHWRASVGDIHPTERKLGNERELMADVSGITTARPPKGAPARYELVNFLQLTDMGSWQDLSRLMAPLYAHAAAVVPDSALKLEAARIAATSADPKVRTLAALKLVQEQVRYLLLAMDDGGYIPAPADLTWSRRFGDCKGKTVMLLALLKQLGIEARPALIATALGDGIDTRLPMAGLFDHVLVEAKIGGRTYWLDGTRPGDRDLDRIRTPQFHWALPITAEGTGLVKLVPDPLPVPQEIVTLEMDASNGIDLPAPVEGEVRLEGDAALVIRLGYAQLAAPERDRAMREYWHNQYDFITATTVTLIDDAATGSVRLTMAGTAKMDWSRNNGARWYELDGARVGDKLDITREPGPNRDAPFAVNFPSWTEHRETIRLPNEGHGFVLDATDVDRTVGAYALKRTVKLDGATLRMVSSTRTLASEMAYAGIEPIKTDLASLSEKGAFVRPPTNYAPTDAEVVALQATTLADFDAFLGRARILTDRGNFAAADKDCEAAIALKPGSARAHAMRALALGSMGNPAFQASATRALALDAKEWIAWNARAIDAFHRSDLPGAETALTQTLAIDPNNSWARQQRAHVRLQLGHVDAALEDIEARIKAEPTNTDVKWVRVYALAHAGRQEAAIKDADAIVAAASDLRAQRWLHGNFLKSIAKLEAARADYDYALAQKMEANVLVDRAQAWPPTDIVHQLADVNAALKLEPASETVLKARALLLERAGRYNEAEVDLATAEHIMPKDGQIQQIRIDMLKRQKRLDDMARELDRWIAKFPPSAMAFNNACWEKATNNVQIKSALADCEHAVQMQPGQAAYLDSRGLVRLRLGDLQGALADYDAALKLRPAQAASLFARGLVKVRLARADAADDFAAARKAYSKVDEEFAAYGLAAPGVAKTKATPSAADQARLHPPAAAPM